jgi:hypothetical protein
MLMKKLSSLLFTVSLLGSTHLVAVSRNLSSIFEPLAQERITPQQAATIWKEQYTSRGQQILQNARKEIQEGLATLRKKYDGQSQLVSMPDGRSIFQKMSGPDGFILLRSSAQPVIEMPEQSVKPPKMPKF